MTITFDRTFLPRFDVQFRDEPSESVTEYCYPGAVEGGFVEGISIEINSMYHVPWFASFAAGKLSPNAASAVLTMPNREDVLVISSGEAYIVNTADPQKWEHLRLLPVMGWATVPERELVLLWDFSRVVAYGCTGLAWKTPSISWDGLTFLSLDEKQAVFEVWNAPNESNQSASVDLTKGVVKGGTSPELSHP